MRNFRKVQGLGIIVEIAGNANMQCLLLHEKLKGVGVVVDVPPRESPKVIIYDILVSENFESQLSVIMISDQT